MYKIMTNNIGRKVSIINRYYNRVYNFLSIDRQIKTLILPVKMMSSTHSG